MQQPRTSDVLTDEGHEREGNQNEKGKNKETVRKRKVVCPTGKGVKERSDRNNHLVCTQDWARTTEEEQCCAKYCALA